MASKLTLSFNDPLFGDKVIFCINPQQARSALQIMNWTGCFGIHLDHSRSSRSWISFDVVKFWIMYLVNSP